MTLLQIFKKNLQPIKRENKKSIKDRMNNKKKIRKFFNQVNHSNNSN